ncbi:hypothetical protein [Thalassospira xiamenensis]|uniref:Secreted protein n=1 Tax=Thalassospira xiamenensis TaxID=220697 RepID=A0A285THF1_9PROT|nr:hypothetical protein [Thalassospira xiamenensis]SOC21678.1 hypothetical protein SAMN05428964_103465 [Thalassospira xiamenensis]
MRVKAFLWSCVIIAASSFASPANAEFVYRHKTVDVKVVPDTCDIPWGGNLTNGEDVVAYEKESVPHTESCLFETRVCRDGQLSGSFTQSLCTVQPIPVCGSEGQSGLDCINGTKTTAISHGVKTLQWNGSVIEYREIHTWEYQCRF